MPRKSHSALSISAFAAAQLRLDVGKYLPVAERISADELFLKKASMIGQQPGILAKLSWTANGLGDPVESIAKC